MISVSRWQDLCCYKQHYDPHRDICKCMSNNHRTTSELLVWLLLYFWYCQARQKRERVEEAGSGSGSLHWNCQIYGPLQWKLRQLSRFWIERRIRNKVYFKLQYIIYTCFEIPWILHFYSFILLCFQSFLSRPK